MKTRDQRPATQRGRRGIVLFAAGTLALVLAATGVHAALGSTSPARRAAVVTTPTTSEVPTVDPSPSADASAQAHPTQPSPTVQATVPAPVDPNALADGVYPTYVRAVNLHDATVTVDVLQLFEGVAGHKAAMADGMSWRDAHYLPVYLRNENDLLRTLPVASDARIKFLGYCEAQDRYGLLKHLRAVAKPFTDTFYFAISVTDGTIDGIEQKIAVSGC